MVLGKKGQGWKKGFVLESSKLQAIKAKMGEAGFTPLSQLRPLMQRCRVQVRISRMWESFNPTNGTVFGLDSLLIDDEGGTMQARVEPSDMKRLGDRLVEGKVYALSDFRVRYRQRNFMACRNNFMMRIGAETVVEEIDGGVDSIPLHRFDFVDFGDVHCRDGNNSLLTDVMGQVAHVGGIQQVRKGLRIIPLRDIEIWDLSEGNCVSRCMEILVSILMWTWFSREAKKPPLSPSSQGCVFSFMLVNVEYLV